MKITDTIKIILYFGILFFFSNSYVIAQTPPTPVGPVPNARQIEWYHREMIAFFHFGINTFTGVDGINEGEGKEPPSIFNPTELDCNQWMRVLKSSGIPSGILVAKHADGFCNWPSAYTDYSVKNSPWKNGKGDVVREFTDACKTAGIKAGLYLGPHDRHQHLSPTYTTAAYSDYYASQLSELLRNYGKIWETWWDGAGADELTTPLYTRWADTLRTLQPDCVIFGTKNSNIFADVRWVGNESGLAGDPCWSTINLSSIKNESSHIEELNHGEINGTAYVPAETDVSIRPSWFYHTAEDGQVKTVEELWNIYCNSVGHNSVLLLNFAPDRRGLIPAIDSANAAGLKELIDKTFTNNLASGATVTALHPRGDEYAPSNLVDNIKSTYYAGTDEFTTDTLVFNLGKVKTFDCLMLQEVIELGHRTTGWSAEYSTDGTNWKKIPEATNKQCIGYKWIVRFSPVAASYVRLNITSGKACPAIHSFGLYKQPQSTFNTDGSSLYVDPNFLGNSLTLNVGSYTTFDLQTSGMKDNDISSIRVPVGFNVEAYSEDNFSGTKWIFTSDNPDLSTINDCDNNISSIIINKELSLSLGKTATASTSESNKGNTPDKGNDGDYLSRWCASGGSIPQWWKVDLGSDYKVIGTEIVWEKKSLYKYKIEISSNNTDWKLAVDNTNSKDTLQTQRDSFTEDSVRYVKITVTGLSGGWASFYEFNVYGVPIATRVNENTGVLPSEFNLFQNYPNPFNPSTTIKYVLKNESKVSLEIFDSLGQKVKTLVNDFQHTGLNNVIWNSNNDNGEPVSSGFYICKLTAGDFISTKKLMLLK